MVTMEQSRTPARSQRPITLMLVGGGIRYPAFIGALRAVEELGIPVARVIGASTGAIVAALYAAGRTPVELHALCLDTDAIRFRDVSPRGALTGMGYCRGDALEQWLDEELGGRLLSARLRVPLGVIATDMLSHTAHLLTAENVPDLPIARAVRFSAAIPGVFRWQKYSFRGKEHVFIDGSLMASIIETHCMEAGPTLAIRTFSKRSLQRLTMSRLTPVRYVADLVTLLLDATDRAFLKGERWKYTITVHCGAVPPLSFSLSRADKEFLLEQGYQQTVKYLRYKWAL